MKKEEIYEKIDHTLLSVTATEDEIKTLCDEAIHFNAASVCIPPCFLKAAKEYTDGKIKLCTVIGFPNGYCSTEVKCYETECAVNDGADEIDMVINVGKVKEKDFDYISEEIKAVRFAAKFKTLKVIIETCLLTEEEKIKLCEIVSASGADFIKTSTGFSSRGAVVSDIELFKRHCAPALKIKAAGGIRTLEDAEKFINAGADRIGASAIIKQAVIESDSQSDKA